MVGENGEEGQEGSVLRKEERLDHPYTGGPRKTTLDA